MRVLVIEDEVRLAATLRDQIIQLIREGDGRDGRKLFDFIMVTKYLERIGDHATNIAEWVEFAITGVHKDSAVMH